MTPPFDAACIDALISDPLVALIMDADGVNANDLSHSLKSLAQRLSIETRRANARAGLPSAPANQRCLDSSGQRSPSRSTAPVESLAFSLTAGW